MARTNVETFAADVDAWVRKSEALMLLVFQESVQRLLEKVQTPEAKGGSMPVVTGFLRSSMVVTLNTPHVGFRERSNAWDYSYDPNQYAMVVSKAKLGDTIYAAFAARYAIFLEYGTRSISPRFFVRNAAQQWPQIVNGVAREVRGW